MKALLRIGSPILRPRPLPSNLASRSVLRAMSSSTQSVEEALSDPRGWPERGFRTQVLAMDASSSSPSLSKACEALQAGHLVAFPTETVYGLGASALSTSSALKIFAAKGRPADNPLIVHISSLDMLASRRLVPYGFQLPDVYRCLTDRFWPGALTILLPASQSLPKVVTANLSTVGVRMPSNEVARALIAQSGLPLAAPSANASGRPSPTTAQHVLRDLGGTESGGDDVASQGRLPYILDGGPCQLGLESTVVDGLTNTSELRVLRPGGVSVEAIEEALLDAGLSERIRVKVYGREMARSEKEEATPSTPGMKYRHYSPDARVVLLVDSEAIKSRAGREVLSAAKALGHLQGTKTLGQVLRSQVKAIWGDKRRVEAVEREGISTPPRRLRVGLMSLDQGRISSRFGVEARETGHANPNSGASELQLGVVDDSSAPGRAYTKTISGLEVEIHPFSLGDVGKPDVSARRLFAGLRRLDEGPLLHSSDALACGEGHEGEVDGCDVILVEAVPEHGIGLAFMNRIGKAASESIVVGEAEEEEGNDATDE